jgi:hypothetical protein
MKYIIVCLLSLSLLSNVGAAEVLKNGDPESCGCPLNKNDQSARPRKYKLRSFQDNRRNYKWYDNARRSESISGDQCFNGGFQPNEY